MEILKINNSSCLFIVAGREVKPEELSREDLLTLLNAIYIMGDPRSVTIPQDEKLSSIKNPIEREIVEQLLQKIEEFINNIDNIKQEIDSEFPEINESHAA